MKTLPLNFDEDNRFMTEFKTSQTLHRGNAIELQVLHVNFWRERLGQDKEMLDIIYTYYQTPKGKISTTFPGIFNVAFMSDYDYDKCRFNAYKELDLDSEYDIKDITETVKLLKGF